MKECNECLITEDLVSNSFDKNGICEFCNSFKKHNINVGRFKSSMNNVELINKIKCSYWHNPPKNMKISFHDYNVFTVIRNPYQRLDGRIN